MSHDPKSQGSKPTREPEDPNNLIRQVLEMGEEFPGPAGDVLLSWLLDLKERVDPALAARRLIERHGLPGPPFADTPRGKLIRLLHQTATFWPSGWREWPDAGVAAGGGGSVRISELLVSRHESDLRSD